MIKARTMRRPGNGRSNSNAPNLPSTSPITSEPKVIMNVLASVCRNVLSRTMSMNCAARQNGSLDCKSYRRSARNIPRAGTVRRRGPECRLSRALAGLGRAPLPDRARTARRYRPARSFRNGRFHLHCYVNAGVTVCRHCRNSTVRSNERRKHATRLDGCFPAGHVPMAVSR